MIQKSINTILFLILVATNSSCFLYNRLPSFSGANIIRATESFVKVVKKIAIPELLAQESTGSGTIVKHNSDSTYILTAKHVCDLPAPFRLEREMLQLSIVDSSGEIYHGIVFAVADLFDACIIRSEKINKPIMDIAKTGPTIGDKIYNVSAPNGMHGENLFPIFEGYYSGSIIFKNSPEVDVYTIPSTFGSSGSPIINNREKIIGMVYAGSIEFHHITLSITTSQIQRFTSIVLKNVDKHK